MISMNRFRNPLISSLAMCLLACLWDGLAHAKDKPEGAHGGPAFKVSSWGNWSGPELFVKTAGKWERLELLDMGYAKSFGFPRDQPLVFCSRQQTAKGESYVPEVTIAIPQGCREPLVLLVPVAKVPQAYVVDLCQQAFPWGSYQFVNFTGAKLAGMVASTQFVLDPGKSHCVNPAMTGNGRMAIQVKAQVANAWETVYSNMVINRPTKRMLVFFHPTPGTPGGGAIETRCLVDFRQDGKGG